MAVMMAVGENERRSGHVPAAVRSRGVTTSPSASWAMVTWFFVFGDTVRLQPFM